MSSSPAATAGTEWRFIECFRQQFLRCGLHAGETVTVLADASGSFLVVLPTRPSERGGERTVVAQVGELSARADVDVVRRPSGSPTGLPSGN